MHGQWRELTLSTNKTVNMIFKKRRKRNEEPKKNHIKTPNHILKRKYPLPGNDFRQHTKLERAYRVRAKSKRTINTMNVVKEKSGEETRKP